jgi:hypothetical protein
MKTLTPKFIPMPIAVLKEWYWLVEACIVWYLDFYQNQNEDFSATNEELSELLLVSESTIKRALKNLNDDWIIEISKSMKEWGWQLRKISLTEIGLLLSVNLNHCKGSIWPSHNIIQEINNNIVPFETFRTEYPHARKWKKAESKKYYDKLNSEEVMKQVHILKRKIKAWLQDWQYIPACERWIRDFTPLNEDVVKQDLVRICKWHLNAWWDMKQRSMELKETFWEQQINEIVKAIQKKDSPKILFTNP